MKSPILFTMLTIALTLLSGCATPPSPSGVGMLYMNHIDAVQSNPTVAGRKKGEACVKNYLGWVTSGDASLSAAMKDGGIVQVSSVDRKYHSVLGIYSKTCLQVTGN